MTSTAPRSRVTCLAGSHRLAVARSGPSRTRGPEPARGTVRPASRSPGRRRVVPLAGRRHDTGRTSRERRPEPGPRMARMLLLLQGARCPSTSPHGTRRPVRRPPHRRSAWRELLVREAWNPTVGITHARRGDRRPIEGARSSTGRDGRCRRAQHVGEPGRHVGLVLERVDGLGDAQADRHDLAAISATRRSSVLSVFAASIRCPPEPTTTSAWRERRRRSQPRDPP